MLRPLPYVWNGEAMVPVQRFRMVAARQFKKDETYVLEPYVEIDKKERGHYHATIAEAWGNLNEEAVERYPSPEHLRKWALVKAGWRTENFTVCDNETRALQLAAFVRNLDDYAVVVANGNVVRTYIARSQKVGKGRMTPEEWRQSKRDVLDILSGKIGVSRKALEREGKLTSP